MKTQVTNYFNLNLQHKINNNALKHEQEEFRERGSKPTAFLSALSNGCHSGGLQCSLASVFTEG
jgi:hypothetical protein